MAAPTIRQLIAARQRPDTPAEINERVRMIAAGRQAHAETMAKFIYITAENIDAALRFQEARIQELMRCAGEEHGR